MCCPTRCFRCCCNHNVSMPVEACKQSCCTRFCCSFPHPCPYAFCCCCCCSCSCCCLSLLSFSLNILALTTALRFRSIFVHLVLVCSFLHHRGAASSKARSKFTESYLLSLSSSSLLLLMSSCWCCCCCCLLLLYFVIDNSLVDWLYHRRCNTIV